MKKYLILFFLLTALAAAFLPWAHSTLTPMEEDLELRETIHEGDKSAAEGITLSFRLKSGDDTLYWDSAFLPAAEVPLAATEMSFYSQGREEIQPLRPHFNVGTVATGFGVGSPNVETTLEEMYYECAVLPALDLYRRTPAGESRTEVMRLADYYDVYPLTCSLYGFSFEGARDVDYYYDMDSYGPLTEYFSIPVPEDEYVEVTVDHTEPYYSGSSASTGFNVNCNSAEGSPTYSLGENYVAAEKGVFLQLWLEDISTGEPARETEALSRQIHLIPYASVHGTDLVADTENISLFYELEDPSARILALEQLDSRLLIFSEEGNELWLTTVDMASGETLQNFYLLTFSERKDLEQVVMEEEFLLAETSDGLFCVVETGEGELGAALSGVLPQDFWHAFDYSYRERRYYYHASYDRSTHFAWDGERLVLAGFRAQPDTEGGLHLAVLDHSGVIFRASYATFIDWEAADDPRALYRPADLDAVSIHLA